VFAPPQYGTPGAGLDQPVIACFWATQVGREIAGVDRVNISRHAVVLGRPRPIASDAPSLGDLSRSQENALMELSAVKNGPATT